MQRIICSRTCSVLPPVAAVRPPSRQAPVSCWRAWNIIPNWQIANTNVIKSGSRNSISIDRIAPQRVRFDPFAKFAGLIRMMHGSWCSAAPPGLKLTDLRLLTPDS